MASQRKLLMLLSVIVLMPVADVAAQALKDKDVVIVNTPAQPVPTAVQSLPSITGNVSVTNTPTVNLQSGAAVGISPTNNTVRIGNVVSVTDTDSPVNQPVDVLVGGTFSGLLVATPNGCIFVAGTCTGGTVPAGKRLVLESVGADVRVPVGQKVLVSGNALRNGIGMTHPIPMTGQGTFFGRDVFHGARQLRLYLDPGMSVGAVVERDNNSGDGSISLTFSGYFVDLP